MDRNTGCALIARLISGLPYGCIFHTERGERTMINVIIADDEPMIIRGLRKLIPWEELGIQIVGEAWTGRGLLELVQQHRPSLVVTDISMPDGTGIDVLKEIARLGFHTKVIF